MITGEKTQNATLLYYSNMIQMFKIIDKNTDIDYHLSDIEKRNNR